MDQGIRAAGIGAAIVLAGGLTVTLTGCGTLNEDLAIGDDLVLPALVPDPVLREPAAGEVAPATVPSASVVSITRENWEATGFMVPNAWVEHRAESHTDPRYTSAAIRREAFPTEQSVLDGGPLGPRVRAQALEGVAAPFYAGLDLVMAVPRMVIAHPWTVQVSPREAYERWPRTLRPVVPWGTLEEEAVEEVPEAAPPPVPSELGPEMPARPVEPGR